MDQKANLIRTHLVYGKRSPRSTESGSDTRLLPESTALCPRGSRMILGEGFNQPRTCWKSTQPARYVTRKAVAIGRRKLLQRRGS
eukprot:1190250-Prorocentrum_minimum.AAC.8